MNTPTFASLNDTLSKRYPTTTFTFLTCDVSSWESISSCFSQTYSTVGHIDIVIANAGISKESRLIDDDVNAEPSKPLVPSIDVNLVGCIYTVKLGIHYLRRNTPSLDSAGRGTIIATASNAGIYAFPVAPIYAATKAGVINLVRSLAPTLSSHHIQISALAPAVLATNIAPDPKLFEGMILTPMSTMGRAVDVLCEEGRTGTVVEVHGERVSVRDVYGWVDEDSRRNVEEFTRLGYA